MKNEPTRRFLYVIEQLKSLGKIQNNVDLAEIVPICYPQKMSNMKNGSNSVTIELIEELVKAFPIIDTNYIFTGQGPIFHEDTPQTKSINEISSQSNDSLIAMIQQLLDRIQEKDEIIREYSEKLMK